MMNRTNYEVPHSTVFFYCPLQRFVALSLQLSYCLVWRYVTRTPAVFETAAFEVMIFCEFLFSSRRVDSSRTELQMEIAIFSQTSLTL
jgi:hypothetical protein